jgi:hypothetical protein
MVEILKIKMDAEDVGEWITIGFELSSYKECLMYARDSEEREIWRQKVIETQIKQTTIMEEFIFKYKKDNLELDINHNNNIRVEHYGNRLILPVCNNNPEGNNDEK